MTTLPRIRSFPGGLRFRFAAVATSLVIATAVAGAAVFGAISSHQLGKQFESTMTSLATNLSRNAAHGVFIESGEVLRELSDNLMAEPDVRRVGIYNARGERILDSGEKTGTGAEAPSLLGEVVVPVLYDAGAEHEVSDDFAPFRDPPPAATPGAKGPQRIGEVRVTYSRARLAGELGAVRSRIWIAAVIAGALGSLIGIWLADRMIQPLKGLIRATTAVAAGDLQTRVRETGDDEVANLARSFNRMTEALRVSRGKLEDTYGELARKDRLATLGQFTAVIAHELRNPLGVIMSSAQVITNPKRTAEMKERAATFIVEEVRRLNTDLTSFLNFARPKPPDIRSIDLADAARRAVEAFRNTPGSGAAPSERTPTGSDPATAGSGGEGGGGIIATVHAEADRPLAAADPDQMHQVLLNLLLNASQAMQQASVERPTGDGLTPAPVTGRIDVRIKGSGGRVALIVEDDGPGMTEEVRSHVFEPFFTTKKRGSGLGLAVVDQIARSHGGSVELTSAPGQGTRFTILLPAATAEIRMKESR